jgi:beta-glucosidase
MLSITPFVSFLILLLVPLFLSGESKVDYLDDSLDPKYRVADLISRMTLREKVGQMCQFVGFNYLAKSNKGLTAEEILNSDSKAVYKGLLTSDIADMLVAGEIGSFLHVLDPKEANQIQKLASSSRLQIPVLIGIDAIHGNGMVYGCTVYPSPITIASSFSSEFAYQVGRQTALEMRATGSHWAFTPNVDVLRDPRWGRVGETFGEDTKLVGDLGVSMIEGFQQEDFSGLDSVIACAKHLVAGSDPVNGLNFAPMDISERSLREIYLKPYQRAVDAGVYSIMSAHHEINGVPCVMNNYLMNEIVRDEYGFNGFFVSDWLDIERLEDLHKVAKNLDEASVLAVNAGTDMHMHGPDFLQSVLKGVETGQISEERINDACSKILLAKFKLGLH